MLNCIHVHIIITILNRGCRTAHTRQKHATKHGRHECTLIAPQLSTDDMWRRRNENACGGKVTRTTLRRSESEAATAYAALCMCTSQWAGGVWSTTVECGSVDDLDEVVAGPTAGGGGAAVARSAQCCQNADVERPSHPRETMTFRAKRVGRP